MPGSSLYDLSPPDWSLSPDVVHIWRADLNLEPFQLKRLYPLLKKAELVRAQAFHFDVDHHHFVATRGILRILLGHYLGLHPTEVPITYTEYGKPTLTEDVGRKLEFNLSHSDSMALYALSQRPVGVDVECMRPNLAGEQIARNFFSPAEVAALRALPSHLRTKGFFTCWTRKEAYVKARGEGLSISLNRFAVSVTPGEAASLLWNADDPQEASRWSLHDLALEHPYIGALAVEGHGYHLHLRRWPPRSECREGC